MLCSTAHFVNKRFLPHLKNLSGALAGKSLDEMMRNFELLRDNEFILHVCADHPRAKSTKSKKSE
jgi:hypothetical protein